MKCGHNEFTGQEELFVSSSSFRSSSSSRSENTRGRRSLEDKTSEANKRKKMKLNVLLSPSFITIWPRREGSCYPRKKDI